MEKWARPRLGLPACKGGQARKGTDTTKKISFPLLLTNSLRMLRLPLQSLFLASDLRLFVAIMLR